MNRVYFVVFELNIHLNGENYIAVGINGIRKFRPYSYLNTRILPLITENSPQGLEPNLKLSVLEPEPIKIKY